MKIHNFIKLYISNVLLKHVTFFLNYPKFDLAWTSKTGAPNLCIGEGERRGNETRGVRVARQPNNSSLYQKHTSGLK